MKQCTLSVLFLLHLSTAWANDIFVSNAQTLRRNLSTGTTTLSFDLTWSNSWRIEGGADNHDAAWVFIKYRAGNSGWQHLTLKGVDSQPTGAQIDLSADTRGAFIYRSAPGFGTSTFNDIVLVWDDAADNLPKGAVVTLKVFAVEMVYVPEGPFSLGSNGGLTSEFYRVTSEAAQRTPYRVTSAESIPVGTAVGNLYYATSQFSGDQAGPIPAAYPKGYRAFYCMKYEVSQRQYRDFFNTLTATQQDTLGLRIFDAKASQGEVNRNGLAWTAGNEATTTLPDIPMNFVMTATINAYLDWSGLRPMTELEYEKAGRGPVAPVAGERAWGTAANLSARFLLANVDTPNEQVTNARDTIGAGSASYIRTSPANANTNGPLRCGIFAANSQSLRRAEAGASFYGILELSGNLYESIVTVGTLAGRSFVAQHGDGQLTPNGFANEASWTNGGAAQGARGGSYGTGAADMALSSRIYPVINHLAQGVVGFRGVRSYPAN
ncbi:hypothetical protein LEM8419_03218 [Neolewinella maritima]|uniref:Sulfatase-modifying factor enzyme-like domain-containing protein n=1 Tax=Neolewinella maritima TaxID=1383882 RepID=A0ABM9B4N0_9BACT|nr:SUMF1/EgtB/PvdO family nonheme iron enzyme [Neolewinella maritima]CAH1002300.1 hypothetical protein LEM8419_03218 [Neolewinella maritima]